MLFSFFLLECCDDSTSYEKWPLRIVVYVYALFAKAILYIVTCSQQEQQQRILNTREEIAGSSFVIFHI